MYRTANAFLLTLAISISGCSLSEQPEFRANSEGRDREQIEQAQFEAIEETLGKLFGTPDDPKVPPGVDLDIELLRAAAGPPGSDEQGNQRGLFRRHCAVCHGISGDGRGPTAAILDPYPRDFRRGVMKYTSTAGGAKPAHQDVARALSIGNADTAMPSFVNLPEKEIEALVEYVKYLSMRGETELYLFMVVVDEDEYLPLDEDMVIEEGVLPVAQMWADAEQMIVHQAEAEQHAADSSQLQASIRRGRELFIGKDAQCSSCHGPGADGHGEQSLLYDDWNKSKVGVNDEQTAKLARLFSLPMQRLWPRDLTKGIFHGGDRPIDIYWRIHVGIKGTPMPAGGPAPGSSGVFTPEEIWDLVNYVRSL
jgi:mono/diheme cytochrome c family protein